MKSYAEYDLPCPDKACGGMVNLKFTPYLKEEDGEEELIFWEGRCARCWRNLQLMGEVDRPPVAQA